MKKFIKIFVARIECVWHVLTSSTFELIYADKKGLHALGYFPSKWRQVLTDTLEDIIIDQQRENSK